MGEVGVELEAGVALAEAAGVARERIVLDPGIGFAKRAEDSLRLLARLDAAVFTALDRPLLLGPYPPVSCGSGSATARRASGSGARRPP